MKEFKMMQDQLMSIVKAQMGDLSCVDTNELGEAIDMRFPFFYCPKCFEYFS